MTLATGRDSALSTAHVAGEKHQPPVMHAHPNQPQVAAARTPHDRHIHTGAAGLSVRSLGECDASWLACEWGHEGRRYAVGGGCEERLRFQGARAASA